jgi:N-acetylneuraminic acid mutarotase
MIIWGGETSSGILNSGGKYNPVSDSWTPTSTTNAPEARSQHTAVWSGSKMVVWGGYDNSGGFNTGGRYNPSADSWMATSTTNAPEARSNHTAVWTGNEMIVWGGIEAVDQNQFDLNTGGRYDPGTDTWVSTNTANAPGPRDFHSAIWTGSKMIVWGGEVDRHNALASTGGRYCAQSAPTPTPTPTPTATPRGTPRPRPTPHPRPSPP